MCKRLQRMHKATKCIRTTACSECARQLQKTNTNKRLQRMRKATKCKNSSYGGAVSSGGWRG